MEPIRVLHVFGSLRRGGAETMILNQYRNIDKTRIQFDFLVNERDSEPSIAAEITRLGGRIYTVPELSPWNIRKYRQAWITLLQGHPEWKIIHGHNTSAGLLYIPLAKAFNRITIAHSHTAGGEYSVKSLLKRLLRYPLRHMADYLAACSEKSAKWMFGNAGGKVLLLRNGIDISQCLLNPAVREEKRKALQMEDRFIVGHVGRFHPLKNHRFLLKVFQQIRKKEDSAVLLLVGDGKYRTKIEKEAGRLKLEDSVIFAGVRSDVPQLLQAMDAFVFPSRFEGIPLALLEAQAAGLYCVASTKIDPAVKICDGLKLMSLHQSPEEWAEAVLACKDLERRNTSGELERAGYSARENAKRLERYYFTLLEEKTW